MDRNTILLAFCFAAAPILAGCTASAMPVGTAQAVQPPADQAAGAWAGDAQLVAILGVEGAWSGQGSQWSSSGSGDDFYGYEGGDSQTDGRCEIWAFQYMSASKGLVLTVAVDSEGNVLDTEEDELEDEVPVGNYAINSDRAIEIALGASDELRESQDHENHHSMLALGRGETDEPAMWMVTGGGYDDGDYVGGMVLIDANSGQVLMSQDFGNSWGSFDGYGEYDYGGGWGTSSGQTALLAL